MTEFVISDTDGIGLGFNAEPWKMRRIRMFGSTSPPLSINVVPVPTSLPSAYNCVADNSRLTIEMVFQVPLLIFFHLDLCLYYQKTSDIGHENNLILKG